MSGSRRVVGSDAPKEWPSQWFYDQKVRLPQINVIHQACELVGAAVGRWIPTDEALLPLAFEKEPGVRPHPFELPLDAESERWVESLGLGSGYAMLSPTAGWGGKEWGVERFGALTAGLRVAGVPVVVNAVAGRDTAAAEAVAARGATVVPSTLAQMIALVRRAGIMIGGDSGPVHMAAALGRPVVMLFGATDPARNGPDFVGARARVMRHPSSVTDYRHHQHTDEGLKQIRVEEVLAAALAMLGDTGQA
jgi:heptosyltransferase-1